MRLWTLNALAITALLAACATVTDETRRTAVLEKGFNAGQVYEIRERTVEGQAGTYTQTSVIYRGYARTCIIDSPQDCETKAQSLIDQVEESIFF
ncbi:hypothetical protein ROLI_031650 [Roseobacter fucihabitans]|uniref:Lipoprotein n=1 Tax=Roseobacter fucihabitans TaxID=1537242 RepID=A0ABZ2BVI6_9RHOB|nr:hypothetical protein [Roseobacter litoralis]MBC6968176.1 hypothetical protein [Roseobacter litoralis]